MKGIWEEKNYAGFSEYLTVKEVVPSNTKLVAYSPESESKMSSYTIGASANAESSGLIAGISATTNVEKKH